VSTLRPAALVAAALFVAGTLGPPGRTSAASLHAPAVVPGAASQVVRLVRRSHAIVRLPSTTVPSLAAAPLDDAETYEPSTVPDCSTATRCVFADRNATRTVVLLGDSHARMWVPALVPALTRLRFRLVLLWYPSCPVANVPTWYFKVNGPYRACDQFRIDALTFLRRRDPWLVLLGDSTTRKFSAANPSAPVTGTQWRIGMQHTIAVVKAASRRVAVIGDLTAFGVSPPECLAAHAAAIQRCSVPSPNPMVPSYRPDEQRAAGAMHVAYLDPLRWLCAATCSPIVGDMIVYSDTDHVAFTYAEFLSGVMGAALRPLLAASRAPAHGTHTAHGAVTTGPRGTSHGRDRLATTLLQLRPLA